VSISIAMFAAAFKFLEPHLAHVPVTFDAYECVVAMFALVYASKFLQAGLSFVLLGKYDNVQANYRNGGFEGKSWRHKAVQRAYNAHQNHWEAFTAFGIAMALALTKVGPERHHELALLGNAFLLQRVAFNAVYIVAFNEPLSFVRSSVWLVGVVLVVRIFTVAVL
jgi:uncharacterized MAPEG superfamily protein